jgi:hypothetical protein
MIEAVLIEKCADPFLTPAIVEEFVAAAGASDPFALTVKSGGRLILVPKPKTSEEAMAVAQRYVGQADVRVGITQFPAGVGVNDASQISFGLVDACENLRLGTRMFAKILRIVAKWYGNPTSKDVMPQMFEDAIISWKTGQFEGVRVFQADDIKSAWKIPRKVGLVGSAGDDEGVGVVYEADPPMTDDGATAPAIPEADASKAHIRIDMSRVGGQ